MLDRIVRALTSPVELREVRKPERFANKIIILHSAVLRRSKRLALGNANATTYGNTVVFSPGCETLGTLVHELVHVAQWRRYGAIGFLWRWLFHRQSIEGPAYAAGDPYHVDGL